MIQTLASGSTMYVVVRQVLYLSRTRPRVLYFSYWQTRGGDLLATAIILLTYI